MSSVFIFPILSTNIQFSLLQCGYLADALLLPMSVTYTHEQQQQQDKWLRNWSAGIYLNNIPSICPQVNKIISFCFQFKTVLL